MNNLTPEQCQDAVDAVKAYGTQIAAAKALGLSRGTLQNRLWRAPAVLAAAEKEAEKPEIVTRAEARDAKYWKKRANTAENHLSEAEHLIREISGVRETVIQPPDWLIPAPNGKKSRSVVAGVVSDTHVGEKVRADELDNANSYDIESFRRRYRRLIGGFIDVGHRWIADCHNVGFLYLRGGDTISGDIHEELRITNELTSHQQVAAAVEEEAAGIDKLVGAYGRVHVASVPGNHARTTLKPVSKQYASTSYDTLIADMLADRFRDNDKVTFQTSTSVDVVVPVFGWQLLLTHGDSTGSGGGKGRIGAVLPILRGMQKVRDQQNRLGRRVDIIVTCHYHSTTNPERNSLGNGSMVGYSQFAHKHRFDPEIAQQWMFLVHEKWCVRERCPVLLEDPEVPPRDRVRIPAVMQR